MSDVKPYTEQETAAILVERDAMPNVRYPYMPWTPERGALDVDRLLATLDSLRARADRLERELGEARRQTQIMSGLYDREEHEKEVAERYAAELEMDRSVEGFRLDRVALASSQLREQRLVEAGEALKDFALLSLALDDERIVAWDRASAPTDTSALTSLMERVVYATENRIAEMESSFGAEGDAHLSPVALRPEDAAAIVSRALSGEGEKNDGT